MFEAIKLCQPVPPHKGCGTMLLVGNYTGDILNAGLAITRAKAAGFNVRFVPVGDDVAVGRAQGVKVGRRGLSGHLIALKLACALAEQGANLVEVAAAAENVAANVGTIAVAFDRVALPNALITDLPLLSPNTIEVGMGAHGEPGLERISPIPPLPVLIKRMISLLADTLDADRAFIPLSRGDRVALLVNSLGATDDGVLGVYAEHAIRELKDEWGLDVARLTLGPLVTSLKMSGVGLTVWKVEGGEAGERQLRLWDQRVTCAAWRQ
ncbi:MAG: Dihydroxyacetone kinase 2 [Vezdaea aestivalis]|nr:MAG: Dihydroxyacetone kinase 2 [Vezdaea aestivalis]